MGLTTGHHQVATSHGHCAVRIACFLKVGLAFQIGFPLDDAGGLAVSRRAGSHLHLTPRRPRDDGG